MNEGGYALWCTMMVFIAYGYITFLIYALLLCCGGCLLCCVACAGGLGAFSNNKLVDRIPYLSAIKTLKKSQFKNLE